MNKTNKSSLFKTSVFAALVAGALSAHAAGLGKLTVYSAIGQPLNAELAVTATPEELNSLAARLAPHAAFRDAGIELMPALTGLRFNIVKSKGQSVLRLTTDTPLNEPFLHFLVELNWSSGRVIREYTFLLDPPEMLQVAKPASVVTPVVPQGQIKSQPVPQVKVTPAAEPVAPAPVAVRRSEKAAAGDYQVKAGDTLGKIAREYKPEGVTLDQMLVALFNSNRDAFDGSNMNRLRAGKILKVPDAVDTAAVAPVEARKIVIDQSADFNAYRRRLAEATATAPAADASATQQASGKIKAQVETKVPAAPAADKLEVSRTEAAKAVKSTGKANLEEDLIARDKQLREASERIAQLEKNLENLKKLAEIKSQGGAQQQQQAEAAKAAPPAAEKKPEPAPAPAPVAVTAPAAPPVAATPVVPPAAEKPVAAEVKPEVKPAEVAPAAKPEAAPVAPPDKPAAAPQPEVKKPAPPPTPAPEPSFVEENPELVGGVGLLALLLGYFGYAAWRKKKQAQQSSFDDLDSVTQNVAPSVVSAPVAAVDNGEVSILGDFSESASLIAEENVDPVAEADVLLAYGRDKQAEEILLEGLKSDPQNSAIHLKLLELYAQRKDEAQFQVIAQQLHDQTGGQGPVWDKAVAIASFLGIAGGIFADGEVTVADLEPVAAESEGTVILEESPLASVEPELGGGDLEFDLDLGTASMAESPVAEESVQFSESVSPVVSPAVSEAPAKQEPFVGREVVPEGEVSLDFDFDIGGSAEPVALAEAAPIEAPVVSIDAEPAAVDFALDDAVSSIEVALPSAEVEDAPIEVDLSSVQPEPVDEPVDVAAVESVADPVDVTLADANAIDFSVDLVETPVAEAPVVEDLSAVTAGGLDFDFDLGVGSEVTPEARVDAVDAVEAVEAPLDLSDISLDLDEPESSVGAPAIDLSISEPTMPEMDFDLDLGTSSGAQEVAPVIAQVQPKEVGTLSVDLPDIDLSFDTPNASPTVLDLGSANTIPDLDLGADLGADSSVAAVDPGQPDDPEVATKLELAQAYEEMGDREGARELLNEVLNEGSAAQRAAASTRLERLAG